MFVVARMLSNRFSLPSYIFRSENIRPARILGCLYVTVTKTLINVIKNYALINAMLVSYFNFELYSFYLTSKIKPPVALLHVLTLPFQSVF